MGGLLVAKKVLIVDGTESDLALLRQIVTLARFTVFEANSGVQALKIHRQEHVDLIVMDLQTPGMDGEQVTRTIRAERTRRTVSILLFADRSRPGLRERCLAAGANDFVSKPFKNADLLARFESLMNIGVRKQTALLAHVKAEDAEADVKPFVARIVNVSATGLLLEANESLATGRRVRVKFFVPGSTAQISASATVVRRADAGGTVRWGVRFTSLDDSARRIILDYVSV
jgi:two-component system, cell cycle response regulator